MAVNWGDLFKGDSLGWSLMQDAADAFRSTKEDRDLIHRVNAETQQLAEDFLNAYLTRELDATAEEIRGELQRIRIERKVPNIPRELSEIYKNLGIIRDYSSRTVELDYPQSVADPLLLRGYPSAIIRAVGESKGVDAQPLIDVMEKAYHAMGLSPSELAPDLASHFTRLSVPLLLKYMDINSTKVYFMGPVFYGDAGEQWTLTFATGSGLPDPLEWNGALWFQQRYGVTQEDLRKHGLKPDKNPFRALNFTVGICNNRWNCKRLYVWQRSKTAKQMQGAYAVAKDAGKEELYLYDAVRQLIGVFETPNLKIIELGEFPLALTAWTRVSPNDIMLSCRPGTPESKISHAIWLRPGLRLSGAALQRIKEVTAGLLGASVTFVPDVGPFLGVLAVAGAYYLLGKLIKGETEEHRKVILDMQAKVAQAYDSLWTAREVSGLVKHSNAYHGENALKAACGTASSLLHLVTPEEALDAYRKGHELQQRRR